MYPTGHTFTMWKSAAYKIVRVGIYRPFLKLSIQFFLVHAKWHHIPAWRKDPTSYYCLPNAFFELIENYVLIEREHKLWDNWLTDAHIKA